MGSPQLPTPIEKSDLHTSAVSPQGAFLVEIKSRPGIVRGDQTTWTWEHEGQQQTEDNPVLLANRKCKRLKSLLARQRDFLLERLLFECPTGSFQDWLAHHASYEKTTRRARIYMVITNAAQHVRLTETWIFNRHRSGDRNITTDMKDIN